MGLKLVEIGVRNNRRAILSEFIGSGAISGAKPFRFSWFDDIHGPESHEFIRSRATSILHAPVSRNLGSKVSEDSSLPLRETRAYRHPGTPGPWVRRWSRDGVSVVPLRPQFHDEFVSPFHIRFLPQF